MCCVPAADVFMTTAETCRFLRVSRQWLRSLRKRGKLSYVQLSSKKLYYRRADVLALLQQPTA